MSLDLITSLDTRFFADDMNSHDLNFDIDTPLQAEDDALTFQHLAAEAMLPYTFETTTSPMLCADQDFMSNLQNDNHPLASKDETLVQDSAILDFDFQSIEESDPTKLDLSCFPNLQADMEHDGIIKVEPCSPLTILQPGSPFGELQTSLDSFELGAEFRILETPPTTPPQLNNSPPTSPQPSGDSSQILKVITLQPNGNLALSNGTKLLVTPAGAGQQNRRVAAKTPKLQPKPLGTTSAPVAVTVLPRNPAPTNGKVAVHKVNQNAAQPLVLTMEELASLTQQGVLNIKSENNAVKTTPPVVPRPAVSVGAATNPVSGSTPPHYETNVKALKRQQRMIKNRESASLSRKKKKEYLSSLEATVTELSKENGQLKQENAILREKVALLEKERDSWSHARTFLSSDSTKKATALFAVLLMVTVNVASLGNLYSTNQTLPLSPSSQPEIHIPLPSHHARRSLLWASEDPPVDGAEFGQYKSNASLQMCPMLINQTESLRIDNDLRGWFQAPASNSAPLPASSPVKLPSAEKSSEVTGLSTRSGLVMSSTAYRKYLLSPQNTGTKAKWTTKNEIQLYESVPDRYLFAAFFDAIQRKDDTFYVVSFSGDHLLLPATEQNKTSRPRMSLLMPAMPLNESMQAPPQHVAMMQIDCEVTNTRLLHISEEIIPAPYGDDRTTGPKATHYGSSKRSWKKFYKGKVGEQLRRPVPEPVVSS